MLPVISYQALGDAVQLAFSLQIFASWSSSVLGGKVSNGSISSETAGMFCIDVCYGEHRSGVFGESPFSDATVELFSLHSCFQGVGSGVCRSKEGREYSDFINIKIIGKNESKGWGGG